MPKDGYYFDRIGFTEMHTDFEPPSLDEVRETATRFTDDELDWMCERAWSLRQETDKALLLGPWGAVGLGGVGSMPDFLCLLATDRSYVKELIDLRAELLIKTLSSLWDAIGEDADIIGVDGQDFGSQRGELFSPSIFEDLYLPNYCRVNEWVHEHTTWKTWLHTCGSVAKLLPMFVESGLDIINPVQCSAEGMDPKWLKESFGDRLTFWGGGVDTQKTLPFGTPDEVRREVSARLQALAPGGGFVFNPVHNVQHGTPPENVVAAYDTAAEAGRYPVG